MQALTIKDFVDIRIDPEDKTQAESLRLDYYISELDEKQTTIQLDFENPEKVSMSS